MKSSSVFFFSVRKRTVIDVEANWYRLLWFMKASFRATKSREINNLARLLHCSFWHIPTIWGSQRKQLCLRNVKAHCHRTIQSDLTTKLSMPRNIICKTGLTSLPPLEQGKKRRTKTYLSHMWIWKRKRKGGSLAICKL